jgi:hypothetical protein
VITTRVRLLTANFRLEPVPGDIAAGRGWPVRKPLTIALLKEWKPSVICGQECSNIIRADIATALGANWKLVHNGNVIIFYDSNQHDLISSARTMLPTPAAPDGTTDPRRLQLAQLQMKATGQNWWAASTHFSAGVNEGPWKIKQMQAIIDYIKANGDLANTILGGDINSSLTDSDGPRKTARAGGLWDLRNKLALARIRNGTSNTFNSWQQPVPHNNSWIDDVFTGDNFQPYYSRVIDTNGASDHQFIVASSIQLT